jgi:hypothetical protein
MRALMLMILFVGACAQAPHDEPSGPTIARFSAGAWLGKLHAAHAAADAASSVEAQASALDALSALASEAAPESVAAADAAAMRRDLYGRAARLALRLGRFEDAEALIQRGLDLEGRDPFHTQLLLLSVETRRALGDEPAARQAEQRAREELAH